MHFIHILAAILVLSTPHLLYAEQCQQEKPSEMFVVIGTTEAIVRCQLVPQPQYHLLLESIERSPEDLSMTLSGANDLALDFDVQVPGLDRRVYQQASDSFTVGGKVKVSVLVRRPKEGVGLNGSSPVSYWITAIAFDSNPNDATSFDFMVGDPALNAAPVLQQRNSDEPDLLPGRSAPLVSLNGYSLRLGLPRDLTRQIEPVFNAYRLRCSCTWSY
jgi:hypothetical protein